MTFLWPSMLWSLLLLPLFMLLLIRIGRQREQRRAAYPGLGRGDGRGAGGGGDRGRDSGGGGTIPDRRRIRARWLPWAVFLAGLAALGIAAARPSAVVLVPRMNQTILLALDSSLSMRAGDVKPSRLEAVQRAARDFIAAQPSDTRIGVISFAATASVVQMPTAAHDEAAAAVDRLTLQRGTAIGSAILVALGVLFPQDDFERMLSVGQRAGREEGQQRQGLSSLPGSSGAGGSGGSSGSSGAGGIGGSGSSGTGSGSGSSGAAPAGGSKSDFEHRPERLRPPKVEPGSVDAAAIVVVTDGQSTVGPLPAEAAQLAADFGVRVYTVGVGTPDGEVIEGDGWKVRVKLDESVLKDIASLTRGEFYLAESSADLNRISKSLGSRFVFERKETEITAWFTALGAALMLLASFLSLRRTNRIL